MEPRFRLFFTMVQTGVLASRVGQDTAIDIIALAYNRTPTEKIVHAEIEVLAEMARDLVCWQTGGGEEPEWLLDV